MRIKIKNIINTVLILLLPAIICTGQASAQTSPGLSNAVYLNSSYVQELTSKTNCDLNGAWSTEYSYYWLADPVDSQANLPSYVKSITHTGVIQESSPISISTPESASSGRNKYYLSSSLPGENLEITIDLENTKDFATWLPLNLYFDPFVIKNPQEQIKLKLSYADSSLGNIIYIQNTKFSAGCYLNLLVKSPGPHSTGKLTIEIDPQDDSTAAISGIFWSEPRQESNLKVTYTGLNKISAPSWSENLRADSNTVIWSPKASTVSNEDDIVKIGIGKVTSTTSTGYEFPISLKNKGFYNFKVLQGIKGPKGVNGLEFYLSLNSNLCLNGCELGLYSTEAYKQNVFIYSAEENKKNKLETNTETTGDGGPVFQNFHIDPNSNVQLRIRLTTNDLQNSPVLRGLYISPTGSENKISDSNNIVLNIDENTSKNTNLNTDTNQSIIAAISAGTIYLPQAISYTTNTTNLSNGAAVSKPNAMTNPRPLSASEVNPRQKPENIEAATDSQPTPPASSIQVPENTQTTVPQTPTPLINTVQPPAITQTIIQTPVPAVNPTQAPAITKATADSQQPAPVTTQTLTNTQPMPAIPPTNNTVVSPFIKHAPIIFADPVNLPNKPNQSSQINGPPQPTAQQQAIEDAQAKADADAQAKADADAKAKADADAKAKADADAQAAQQQTIDNAINAVAVTSENLPVTDGE